MIHIKNMVHCLRVKWMFYFCEDVGVSWPRYVWDQVEQVIPLTLLAGVRAVNENLLKSLSPFYACMIHSFAFVNNLFYEANPEAELPHNIWFSNIFPFCDQEWYLAGVNTICDLLLTGAQIDYAGVEHMVGRTPGLWLHCCTLQGMLMKYYKYCTPGQHLPADELKVQMKNLLHQCTSSMLTLTR